MALINEYFELTNKYKEDYGEKMILLMLVGSFFEVYGILDKNSGEITGSEIQEFSRVCELNIVEKNVCVGEKNVLMAGFKDFSIEKYIKKLQNSGFTSVVYTQDEAAKNTTRSLYGIFSPGTYFSDDSCKLSNNTICIWIDYIENMKIYKGKYIIAGVANIDIYTGKTSLFQYKENYIHSPTTYDDLERYISIYNPNEVIIISNLPEKEINDVIQFINIRSNSIHKVSLSNENPNSFTKRAINCEKQVFQKEILERFYKNNIDEICFDDFNENHIASQAFCFLLDFIFQHNPYLMNKISIPIFENYSDRLVLANHSLKQLNIVNDDNENYKGNLSSVVKMLNICLTAMGKRKFDYILLNPTSNVKTLQAEYDMIEYFLNKYNDYSDFLNKRLTKIKDISKWLRQLYLKKISPKSFYQLYNNLFVIKEINAFFKEDRYFTEYFKFHHLNNINISHSCEKIIDVINNNLNIELAKELDQTQQFEENFIQRNINLDLDNQMEVLTDSIGKLESIQKYLNTIIDASEKKGKANSKVTDYIKIHETEKNNFTLITTQRRCKILEDALPNSETIVPLNYLSTYSNTQKIFNFMICKKQFEYSKQSSANNYVHDQQITSLCKTISQLKIKMKDVITQVYYSFLATFEEHHLDIENICHFITLIDVIYAKAKIATKYHYCKPIINSKEEKSFMNAVGLRHCLIEQLLQNELYTSNNIQLGHNSVDGILLYGTNAVGKTSFIRAIGISIIMAQAGLYVPATNFEYQPYKYIFTRILGNDNIFKGLSTFAVEMSELRTILKLADKNSLILGDELCSGTENSSAISIFVAGIQRLSQVNSSFIFATHLHEIIEYSEIKDLTKVVLKHMSVIYDREKDVLIYDRKLSDGPGNSMYGLEVCKSLSLPNDFIEAAYNIRMKYHPEEGSILSLKTSHFNSKKIMSICEKCGLKLGSEVHHLQHQQEAVNNIIENSNVGNIFNKNNLANLVILCEGCHDDFHKSGKQHKKVKTTKGYKIAEINK
jgi:DNA mismatch repair protein MutS